MTDDEIIGLVETEFRHAPRPDHFGDPECCEKCTEIHQVFSGRDRGSLTIDDMFTAGVNPLTLMTEEGFRYYMPDFVRLALLGPPYSRRAKIHLLDFVSFNLFM